MRGRRRHRLAAVLVATVLAACGSGAEDTSASTTTSAPTTSTTDSAQPRRASGTLVHRDADGVEKAWSLTVLADGSFRLEHRPANGVAEIYAFDATTGRSESLGDGFASVYEGRALGGPDYHALDDVSYLLRLELGWHVAALARAKSPKVENTTSLERAAHAYRDTFQANAVAGEGGPNEVRATVDLDSGLPLVVEDRAGGKVVARTEVTKLTFDSDVDRSVLRAGVQEPPDRGAWRWMRDDEPTPLTVGELPHGYEREASAVATRPDPTGPEASNPRVGPAYALSYRHGFGQVVVTMRPVGDDLDAWSDPFGGEGMFLQSSKRRLTAGVGDGANAEIVIDPQTVPHLWVIAGDYVVTVSGPLTADELIAVAESLTA